MKTVSCSNAFFNAPVFYLPETGSTMDDAVRLIHDGAVSGTVVCADFQHSGRGRLPERHWVSPAGRNLLFSLILRMADLPHGLTALSLRCGLGLSFYLESEWKLAPGIKWPNDLLVGGAKIAGILCQGRGEWILVGMGLNLAAEGLPGDIDRPATSLEALCGNRIAPLEVLPGLLSALRKGLAEGNWNEAINQRLHGIGRQVEVTPGAGAGDGGRCYRARILSLDTDGGLQLEDESGHLVKMVSGEIRLI